MNEKWYGEVNMLETTPSVISETPRWLVLEKPAGWLTIPGRHEASASTGPSVLSEWARGRFGKLWIVHRLDRETSGIVLFARTAADHREASLWFQKHSVKKAYDCLAAGNPGQPVFRIRRPVGGASSTTQIEVKEKFGVAFLAAALPLTGRRHQIRIHLAGEKHPILGDTQYGGPKKIKLTNRELFIDRVALHSRRLELPTGEVFEAGWPRDFQEWVEVLRNG